MLKYTSTITIIMVVLFALMFVLLVVAVPAAYSEGQQAGAKIALSVSEYRLDEVRGSCENLFDARECKECHPVP